VEDPLDVGRQYSECPRDVLTAVAMLDGSLDGFVLNRKPSIGVRVTGIPQRSVGEYLVHSIPSRPTLPVPSSRCQDVNG
jgi:hypothetical protein